MDDSVTGSSSSSCRRSHGRRHGDGGDWPSQSCLRQQLYLISPARCTYTIWRSTQNYHLPSENKVETWPFLASSKLVTATSSSIGFVPQGGVVARGNVWWVISALINIRRVQACPYWIYLGTNDRSTPRRDRVSLLSYFAVSVHW